MKYNLPLYFFHHNNESKNRKVMTKKNDNYMALEDFQTLWDDKLKPAIAMKEELGDYLPVITQAEFDAIFN